MDFHGSSATDGVAACRNELLASLDAPLLRELLSRSARRNFASGQYLNDHTADGQLSFFIETGLVFEIERGLQREIATRCVGREGVALCSLFQGRSLARALCVGSVDVVSAPTTVLVRIASESPAFNRALNRYAQQVFGELTTGLLTTAHLKIEQRLARLLDISFQRAESESLEITHGQLSSFLGVRRAGITVAMHMLEGECAIRSRRCLIQLRNADRLREFWVDGSSVSSAVN